MAVATGPEDRALDDLDLVAAVRAGDDRAFEALFLRYQPRIAAYVGRMVRDHGRAEDITQEIFMSALRRLRTDDEREIIFRPWIYEIAKNKCIDAYRRGRNTTEVSFDAQDQIGAAEHGRLAEPGTTPDAAVEGKVALDNLRGAFGGLSPVHHEILVMREFEGLSYREIGERLGMSRAAVESTLFRARKRLGEEYEELVSGKRCLRVQRIVDERGERAAGVRDQRRVARHLAHCQPCRRYAFLAGADLGLARAPSVASRVAAFLPLPAFLRRRWGGGEEAAHMLAQQAARPGVQWSAHVAGALDPGAVSGWAKLAATAATVALAGVGGSAIEHRAPSAPSPAGAAGAAGSAAAQQSRATNARRVGAGLPLPASADAAAAARGDSPTASAGEQGSAPVAPGNPAVNGSPAGPGSGDPGAGAGTGAQHPSAGRPHDPLAPVEDAAGNAVAPVLGADGNKASTSDRPASGNSNASAGTLDPGRLLRPVAPPTSGGAAVGGGSGPAAGGSGPERTPAAAPGEETAKAPGGAGPLGGDILPEAPLPNSISAAPSLGG